MEQRNGRTYLTILLYLVYVMYQQRGIYARNIVVNIGDDIVLQCPLEGNYTYPEWYGPPNSTHLTDSESFPQNTEMSYSNFKDLRIKNPQLAHSGLYTCKTGSEEGNVTFTISAAPLKYIASGTDWFYPKSNNGNFSCKSIDGLDKSTVTWTFSNIQNKTYHNSTTPTKCVQSGDINHLYTCASYLSMSEVSRKDTGLNISCNIYYDDNIIYSHTWGPLKYNFPPTSAKISGNQLVKLNNKGSASLRLTCSSDEARNGEHSGVTFTWYKDGKRVNGSDLDQVDTTDVPSGEYGGFNASQTVTFTIDREMDGTEIKCRVDNVYSSFPPNTYPADKVTLEVEYSPVLLEPVLTTYRVYAGDVVVIPCSAESKPPATFTWVFDSPSAAAVDITGYMVDTDMQDNRGDLRLTHTSISDTGNYMCKASNTIEPDATKVVTLEVYNKPPVPTYSGFDSSSPSTLRVYIKQNDVPSGLPLTYYGQYRKRTEPPSDWTELITPLSKHKNSDTSYDLVINGLSSNTNYDVRVKIVDVYRLASYTNAQIYTTADSEQAMVPKTQQTKAIVISVFATAGVFIIILVLIVCALRKHKTDKLPM